MISSQSYDSDEPSPSKKPIYIDPEIIEISSDEDEMWVYRNVSYSHSSYNSVRHPPIATLDDPFDSTIPGSRSTDGPASMRTVHTLLR